MLQRKYPHAAAGQIAAPVFFIAGIPAGFVMSRLIADAPGSLPNAVIWAVFEAAAAFLAFSSEGPTRPSSIRQAAAADGVVAAITASLAATVIDLFYAIGSSTSLQPGPGTGSVVAALAVALFIGAAIGALLGLLVLTIGGPKLERVPVGGKRSKKQRASARRR